MFVIMIIVHFIWTTLSIIKIFVQIQADYKASYLLI
jgi:hypothetical protein